MNKNTDFLQEIINLSNSDLNKLYQMACQKSKDDFASGKDISEIEHKIELISAEMIRRERKKVSGTPTGINPNLRATGKVPEEHNPQYEITSHINIER